MNTREEVMNAALSDPVFYRTMEDIAYRLQKDPYVMDFEDSLRRSYLVTGVLINLTLDQQGQQRASKGPNSRIQSSWVSPIFRDVTEYWGGIHRGILQVEIVDGVEQLGFEESRGLHITYYDTADRVGVFGLARGEVFKIRGIHGETQIVIYLPLEQFFSYFTGRFRSTKSARM